MFLLRLMSPVPIFAFFFRHVRERRHVDLVLTETPAKALQHARPHGSRASPEVPPGHHEYAGLHNAPKD